MDLWPKASEGSFAVADVLMRPRLSVSSATIGVGCLTPMHRHPAHDQFVHLAEGEAMLRLSEGRTITLREGNTLIIPAGMMHAFATSDGEARILTACLGDDGSLSRHVRPQHIEGWIHDEIFYLRGEGIRLALGLRSQATDQFGLSEQKLIVSDIDYIHPSVKQHPIPKIAFPRIPWLKRISQIQKRIKVLAATYSRPIGLPSAP